MAFDDVADDAEPQPGAPVRGGAPPEAVEDLDLFVVGQARSGVADRDEGLAVVEDGGGEDDGRSLW